MAVTLVTNIQRFNALSSDEWPADPPEGSTLHVIDTGEQYIFYNGTWELDLRLISALRNA